MGCWELQLFPAEAPTSEALCLGQAFCSVLPFFSHAHAALGISQSPPTPFKLIAQVGDFKRFTNAWISNMKAGPGVDRVDNNRLWLQKWDQWAHHRPILHEYLLWAWPCAMLCICKCCPGKPQGGCKEWRQRGRKVKRSRSRYTLKAGTHLGQTFREKPERYWKRVCC